MLHFFFVVIMFLGNKSETVGKPDYFAFKNGARFVRNMHLCDEQQITSMTDMSSDKSRFYLQYLDRRVKVWRRRK